LERTTQRWLIILVVVAAVYLALIASHVLLGVKILPW
jgi:hypothetical protein